MAPDSTPLDRLGAPVEAEEPRLSEEDLVIPAGPADADQETDVWWGAYAGRTFAPVFAFCTLLSVNVSLAVGWYWDEEYPQLMWHLAVLLVVAVWAFPLALWIHRTLSRTYRLTTHFLYRNRGFRRPADGHAELRRIARVYVKYALLQRLVGVGRIVAEVEGGAPLVLDGVHNPEPIADLIRRWSARARAKGP
jgi:hypothetical protein